MGVTLHGLTFASAEGKVWAALAALAALLLLSLLWKLLPKCRFPLGTPQQLSEGFPLLGQLRFYSSRSRFYFDSVSATRTGNFHFHIGQHQFIGLSGEDGRAAFFEERSLEFCQAYRNMFVPIPPSIGKRLFRSRSSETYRAGFDLRKAMRWENLTQTLPAMTQYTSTGFHRIVEQHEIAESEDLLQKSLSYYTRSNLSNSPARIIAPWLPTPSSIRCLVASIRQCVLVRQVMENRKTDPRTVPGITQSMMERGLGYQEVCQFVTMTLFAAQANTPVISSWALICLAHNPYWMEQIRREVDQVVLSRWEASPHSRSPEEVLSTLDLAAWESEFPLIELCGRETLRLYGGAANTSFGGAGAMVSNVLDYAKWLRALVNLTGPISMEVYAGIFRPRIPVRETVANAFNLPPSPRHDYAAGWFVTNYHSYQIYMHHGSCPGIYITIGFIPEKKFGFVMMANSGSAREVHRWLYLYLVDSCILEVSGLSLGFEPDQITITDMAEAKRQLFPNLAPWKTQHALPITSYCGVYNERGYGALRLIPYRENLYSNLTNRAIPYHLILYHVDGEYFLVELCTRWNVPGNDSSFFRAEFGIEEGTVTSLRISFEPALGNEMISFSRYST
ncbi:hypothetical protein FE257_000076 [Aspergillus nanangensis]|uniref:Uncharacterized protein n=1 Tax=Aspergillus nanangensis TaxID=2582783 RepID=A0AAD4CYR2_ASPNN|nr:hypothetical protein FE257_000076 [Aspergillus nanangensis]